MSLKISKTHILLMINNIPNNATEKTKNTKIQLSICLNYLLFPIINFIIRAVNSITKNWKMETNQR